MLKALELIKKSFLCYNMLLWLRAPQKQNIYANSNKTVHFFTSSLQLSADMLQQAKDITENPSENHLILLSPTFVNRLQEAALFSKAKHRIGKSCFQLSLYIWVWLGIIHQVLCLFALCQSACKCEAGYLHISFITHSFI